MCARPAPCALPLRPAPTASSSPPCRCAAAPIPRPTRRPRWRWPAPRRAAAPTGRRPGHRCPAGPSTGAPASGARPAGWLGRRRGGARAPWPCLPCRALVELLGGGATAWRRDRNLGGVELEGEVKRREPVGGCTARRRHLPPDARGPPGQPQPLRQAATSAFTRVLPQQQTAWHAAPNHLRVHSQLRRRERRDRPNRRRGSGNPSNISVQAPVASRSFKPRLHHPSGRHMRGSLAPPAARCAPPVGPSRRRRPCSVGGDTQRLPLHPLASAPLFSTGQ